MIIGHHTASGATICLDCAETFQRADEIPTADAIKGTDPGSATLCCDDCGETLLDLDEYTARESWERAA